MNKTLIIDGLNLFIRSFVVVPSMDADGNPIGGITGFLKSMKNLVKDVEPRKIIVCWDGEGGSRKRRGIFKDYKMGRKVRLNRAYDEESPDQSVANMDSQLRTLKKLLKFLGVMQLEVKEVEADDLIAYLCNFVLSDQRKVVASSDRDFLQLVNKNTLVYSPTKKVYWTCSDMIEKMRVLPENYIFMKALTGDGSDNIKGVKGIGEVMVTKLFPFIGERPTSLEEIFSFAAANVSVKAKYKSVLECKEKIVENMKLMQLSNPVFSVQTSVYVREAISKDERKFGFMELKLEFTRMGIQMIDIDFFPVMNAYKMRSKFS